MLCPVCLDDLEDGGPVVEKHLNSLGEVCAMSGQPSFEWDERATREAVHGRSNGICEFCGAATASDMHHRKSRGVGGRWTPANIIHLCRSCHGRVTDNPTWAYANGLMVHVYDDPADVAVIRTATLWLTDAVAPPVPRKKNRR